MAAPHYDAIAVVGVGAHGSAALYHLAKRGVKVSSPQALLEQIGALMGVKSFV